MLCRFVTTHLRSEGEMGEFCINVLYLSAVVASVFVAQFCVFATVNSPENVAFWKEKRKHYTCMLNITSMPDVVVAALHSRFGHYIFVLWFLSSSFLFLA